MMLLTAICHLSASTTPGSAPRYLKAWLGARESSAAQLMTSR